MMKKKFACLFLVFAFALSVFTTVYGSSRDREWTGEREPVMESVTQLEQQELIDLLNGLDLIGDFEFFLLEDSEYDFGTRSDEFELMQFDTIEDLVMYLDAVTSALRGEWMLSSCEDESIMRIEPRSPTGWLEDRIGAPAPFFTRFNINVRYIFHPNRTWSVLNQPNVITNLSITDSWFSGLMLGARWTHRHATATVTQTTGSFTDYRFSVSGTLFQGAVINGQEIGFSSNEVITGGFWASHNNPNNGRPIWIEH